VTIRRARGCSAMLIAMCAVLPACGSSPPSTCPSNQAERTYGCGPATDGSVTYQPDVVIVSGGADAVRAWSADGLTWTIKGDAPGADRLAPGKIMFVTGLGVGRVLAVRSVGNDRAVIVGPVDLTDVIRDANIASSLPISLAHPNAYTAPALPGTSTDISPGTGNASLLAHRQGVTPATTEMAVETAAQVDAGANVVTLPPIHLTASSSAPSPPPPPGTGPTMPPPGQQLPAMKAGDFTVEGFCCANGLGVRLAYDHGGLIITGNVSVQVASPTLVFDVGISGGKVVRAELQVGGGIGIAVGFDAATQVGRYGNINQRIQVPLDLSVPIVGLGIPFTAQLTQWFVLQTAFSAKDSTLRAGGVFTFGGGLGFGYHDGRFDVRPLENFGVKQSLVDSITGLSIGAAGLVLAHQARFCLCLGAFGFETGLYFFLTSSFGVSNDSSAQAVLRGVRCRGASLDMLSRYGWGYSIPEAVKELVNKFLSIFHAGPISASGGVFKDQALLHKTDTVPSVSACT
jgi:hypothetical protein